MEVNLAITDLAESVEKLLLGLLSTVDIVM